MQNNNELQQYMSQGAEPRKSNRKDEEENTRWTTSLVADRSLNVVVVDNTNNIINQYIF